MILVQGERYRARLRLGLFEQIAANATVCEWLEAAGFVAVAVDGDGRDRHAVGTWARPTQDVELPDQIVASSVEAMP